MKVIARSSNLLGKITALVVISFFAVSVQAKYGGGTGVPNDPYLIYTAEQMNAIGADANDWDKHFMLMADIDLGQFTGEEFNIIGKSGSPYFTGVFDGNYHTISNFTYTSTGKGLIGLFGYVGNYAEIKNIILINPNIDAGTGNWVGSLVGRFGSALGTITNCYVEGGSVKGDDSVGGLVGGNRGLIINCSSTANVSGISFVGGLVGRHQSQIAITHCYAAGSVTGDIIVGGLCGRNHGTITNCYSTGSVTGDERVGGLVGQSLDTIANSFSTGSVSGNYSVGGLVGGGGKIINCYSTGSVEGDMWVGGLAGTGSFESVSESFWDIETSGQMTSAGGMGKTTAEMQMQITFTDVGWDFTHESTNGTHQIWQMPVGGGYPVLSSFNGYVPVVLSGDGTEASPYIINNAAELGAIYHYNSDASFRLQSDIDLTDIQWSIAIVPVFSGCFNGNGYVIYNMNIAGGNYLGFFGHITGQVKNLGVENATVTGEENSEYLGGLCGFNYGTITNCYSMGSITGGESVGGLVGENFYGGIITNCYSTDSVTGERRIGGLVGQNYDTITNCYSMGSVTGGEAVGGLVGYARVGTIINCYSTGSVSGDDDVGGLVGSKWPSSTITASFWNIETSGQMTSAGGIDMTTSEMQTQGTFTDVGWDFTHESTNGTNQIWQMPVGGGYPVLSSFNGYVPVVLSGDGTEDSPYIINNAAELGAIYHYNSNASFRLQSDIDLTGIQWSIAIVPVFSGCFNGNGYVIYNMNIAGGNYLGLFGIITGQVKNLGVENATVMGEENSEYLGGLCGRNNGTIINCNSKGSVTGERFVGGLCGGNYVTITNCHSNGSVTGTSYLGGLCGRNDGTVTNCYSMGSVTGCTGGEGVGGLVGECCGKIANCYSAGSVSGDDDVGGLVGYDVYGNHNSNFWNSEVNPDLTGIGDSSDPADVMGRTTLEMHTQTTFTDFGWDFVGETVNGMEDIWFIPQGDYPRLWWEFVPVLNAEPEITLGTSNIISWKPVIVAVEYYAVCSTDSNFTNIAYNSGWITDTSYDFTNLTIGKQYWYRVKARDSAGTESQWSNVESSLQCSLSGAVETLLKPESLKNKNMKNALLNKIDEALELIEGGLYKDALNKLQNDILQKTNGCAETGEPDKNDWIITCEEQSKIYPLVLETIEHVKSLIE